MRKYMIALITTLLSAIVALASPANDHQYLKITTEEAQYISYPPGTGFIVQDGSGNTLLSPKDLKEQQTYVIDEPITLFVFTSWNSEPDVYEMTSGTLEMIPTSDAYDTSTSYDYGKLRENEESSQSRTKSTYGIWRGSSNGVSILQQRFFDYDEEFGYDTSIEFSNGVIFYYRDGKVQAWQNGKEVTVKGNYLIYATLGVIKVSYDPTDKVTWYVFEKNN